MIGAIISGIGDICVGIVIAVVIHICIAAVTDGRWP